MIPGRFLKQSIDFRKEITKYIRENRDYASPDEAEAWELKATLEVLNGLSAELLGLENEIRQSVELCLNDSEKAITEALNQVEDR